MSEFESAPQEVKSTELKASEPSQQGFRAMIVEVLRRLRATDAGIKSKDFNRQRGIGEGSGRIDLKEEDKDGETPREQVKERLQKWAELNKEN